MEAELPAEEPSQDPARGSSDRAGRVVVQESPPDEGLEEGLRVFDDWVGQLQQLAKLHKEGLLTDEEFAAAKQRLFSDAKISVLPIDEADIPEDTRDTVTPPVEDPVTEIVTNTPVEVEPAASGPVTDQDILYESGDNIFGFQYVEIAYGRAKILGVDFTGIGVEARTEFQPGMFTSVSFSGIEDEYDIAVINSFCLAIGMHRPVDEQTEVYGSLGFALSELDAYIDGVYYYADDSAFVLAGGVLYSPMDKVLLEAGATHVDGELAFEYGARWFVDDQVSLGISRIQLDGGFSEDMTLFGLRWGY